MYTVKITVMKTVCHRDLTEKYELPMSHACDMEVGKTFFSDDAQMPRGFCESAWQSVFPFVLALASGGESIYGSWMRDSHSAMISCNDGFRPVSFLLETVFD